MFFDCIAPQRSGQRPFINLASPDSLALLCHMHIRRVASTHGPHSIRGLLPFPQNDAKGAS
jgi:hypothetical protein